MTLYKEIENYSIDRQLEMICNEVDNLKVQIGMIVTGIEQLKEGIAGIKASPVWKGTI